MIIRIHFVSSFCFNLLVVLKHSLSQLLSIVIACGLTHPLIVFHLRLCECCLFGLSGALVITFVLTLSLSIINRVLIHREVLLPLLWDRIESFILDLLIFLLLDEIVLHLLKYFWLKLSQNLVILLFIWIWHYGALRPHALRFPIVRWSCRATHANWIALKWEYIWEVLVCWTGRTSFFISNNIFYHSVGLVLILQLIEFVHGIGNRPICFQIEWLLLLFLFGLFDVLSTGRGVIPSNFKHLPILKEITVFIPTECLIRGMSSGCTSTWWIDWRRDGTPFWGHIPWAKCKSSTVELWSLASY